MAFRIARGPAVGAVLLTGFLALVSLGLLGLLAVPSIGKALGPLACQAGETMVAHTSTWSRPGETSTSVAYACAGPVGEREIGFFALIKAAMVVYLGFFAFVVFPLVFVLFQRGAARKGPRLDAASADRLAALARKLAEEQPRPPVSPMPPRAETGQPSDSLKMLAKLRDDGLITEAEYRAKKAEILDRM